jgi:hypothetical protein
MTTRTYTTEISSCRACASALATDLIKLDGVIQVSITGIGVSYSDPNEIHPRVRQNPDERPAP